MYLAQKYYILIVSDEFINESEEGTMEGKINFGLSESEALIMEYLWDADSGRCFREITKYLNEEVGKDWKKQTMNTFLSRLTNKGLISAELKRGGRVYSPTVTRTEFATGRAKQFLEKFYDGSLEKFLTILNGGKTVDEQQVKKIMG